MGKFGSKEEHRDGMVTTNKEPPREGVTITWSEEVADDDILFARAELDDNQIINGIVLCKGRGNIVDRLKLKADKPNFSSAHIIVLKKTGKAILDSNKFNHKKNSKMTRNELMIKIKELNEPVDIKDIDFRIQSVTKDGLAIILAYKDARYDMNMLDDKIGPHNWARDHKVINNNLYCGIGIRVPADVQNGTIMSPAEWVWKWDVGTESLTEATKGEASDSFKRAGFNWGIGRELYDFPFICIQLNKEEFSTKQSGNRTIGYATRFRIKSLKWKIQRGDDGKITSLQAFMGATKRYDHSSSIKVAAKKEEKKPTPTPTPTPEKPAELQDQATVIATAIKKVKACKTEATLDKYWTKDFFSLQGVHDFKLIVAVRYAELAKDEANLTDVWAKKFRDMQKYPEFKDAIIKRKGEL